MNLPAIFLALGMLTMNSAQQTEATTAPELTHVVNSFHFEVAAAFARVAPLFGPEGERGWAGKHWNPEFLYPLPAKDTEGAVFKVQHGAHSSVWVNTRFDLAAGRMQYVYFVDDAMVTTVDVRLTAKDQNHTAVDVTYARTAVQAAANDDVRELGNGDRESGPKWQKSIEEYLGIAASNAN